MNGLSFFKHQHVARRNSRMMVFLFVLSVIAIVAVINVLVGLAYVFFSEQPAPIVQDA